MVKATDFFRFPHTPHLAWLGKGSPRDDKVMQGKTTLAALKQLVAQPSHFRQGPLECVVIRRESPDWCEARAKLVRPDFTQAITDHWRKQAIEWNRMDYSVGTSD